MIEARLDTFGTFPDIAWRAPYWYIVWQAGDLVMTGKYDHDGVQAVLKNFSIGGPEASYPRVYQHEGAIYYGWRDGSAPWWGHIRREVGLSDDLGTVHGSLPICFGGGHVAYLSGGSTDRYPVLTRPLGIWEAPTFNRFGQGTGLSRVLDGPQVVLWDEDRTAVSGLSDPAWAESVVVGATDRGGQPCVVARLQDGREHVCWLGQDSLNPRVASDSMGRLGIVAWSGRGEGVRLLLLDDADFTAPTKVYPVSNQPLTWGAYFRPSVRYPPMGAWLGNLSVVVEDGAVGLCERAGISMLVGVGQIPVVTRPDLVRGIELGVEGDAVAVDRACKDARAQWWARFPGRKATTVCYLTPGTERSAGWPPQEPSVYAPQVYFELAPKGDWPVGINVEAWVQWWVRKGLPYDRPWLLTAQAYDRSTWTPTQIQQLADAADQWVNISNRHPMVVGFLFFAIDRPGGVGTYQNLGAALEAARLGARNVSSPSPVLPGQSQPVDPTDPDEPDMPDIAQIKKNVGTPVPRDIALGALSRFRTEVVWPRDQIPAPYDDQVTGGAAAIYFWPNYYAAIVPLLVDGLPSGSADDVRRKWVDLSVIGFNAASQAYWREQGNPHSPQ